MPRVTFTTKGYIEVWRGDRFVSRHRVESEAVESAFADAAEYGDGDYQFRFPGKTVRVIGVQNPDPDTGGGDTIAPSVPTGLVLVEKGATFISVACDASTDNIAVEGYQWFLDGLPIDTTTEPAYSFTGLTPSTAYVVTVAAFDEASNYSGESSPLNEMTDANVAPVWESISAPFELTPGGSFFLDLSGYCSDEDGDPITFAVDSGPLPGGLSLVGANVSGTPTTVQTIDVTFSASDGIAEPVLQVIQFEVLNADTTAPSVPTLNAATNVTQTSLTITCAESTDPDVADARTSGVASYTLQRATNSGFTAGVVTEAAQAGRTWNISGLAIATTYYFRVRATDAAGNVSAYSSTVTATTDGQAPAAPVWSGAPATLSRYENETYNFAQHASDPNAEPMTFTLTAGNTNGYSITTAGVLTVGNVSQSVTVRATDPGGLFASTSCAVTVLEPATGENIIWDGSFETLDFKKYHRRGDPASELFSMILPAGRPPIPPTGTGNNSPSYYGDGSNANLVTSPVTGSFTRSARLTCKKTDTADPAGGDTTRRRSQLTALETMPEDYNALPYLGERWIAVSFYLPSNWDLNSYGGWGPVLWGIKQIVNASNVSGFFGLSIDSGSWNITHRFFQDDLNSDGIYETPRLNPNTQAPWRMQPFYTASYNGAPYPGPGTNWTDGMLDYPNYANSVASLGTITRGGWTDFVIHMNLDARGSAGGGAGFLDLWKRDNGGAWVKVLHIYPKVMNRAGWLIDHGIGFRVPPTGSSNGGYGSLIGLYMASVFVTSSPIDRTIFVANHKVGNENATFSEMSPDGSTP